MPWRESEPASLIQDDGPLGDPSFLVAGQTDQDPVAAALDEFEFGAFFQRGGQRRFIAFGVALAHDRLLLDDYAVDVSTSSDTSRRRPRRRAPAR